MEQFRPSRSMDAMKTWWFSKLAMLIFGEYHFQPFLPYFGWNFNKIDSLTAETLPLDISSPSLGALTCPMATISPNSPTGASLALPKNGWGRGNGLLKLGSLNWIKMPEAVRRIYTPEKTRPSCPKRKLHHFPTIFRVYIVFVLGSVPFELFF